MTVSVIIPLFNAERFIAEAIRSILDQDYSPHEIIVIDDGSTDSGAAVAERIAGVQVFRQSNSGCGPARNHGIRKATGDLIAFLDADDVWLPGKLRAQATWLAANPSAAMVFGWVTQFYEADPTQTIAPMRGYFAGTMVVRRDCFERIGEFPERYKVGEFIDWYARAQEAGFQAGMIDDVVCRRRIHETNLGIRERDRTDFARVAKAALDRRRDAATKKAP